jgi:glucosamine--fructose-6-phosphate aminotransferase (isomerizing)
MCGIIGYVGNPNRTLEVLMEALRRLEYRGYDSCGIAVMQDGMPIVVKSEGKLNNLASKLAGLSLKGRVGIGHTRWATHGPSTELNAHPHTSGATAVVHNGIVENFMDLKKELMGKGYVFSSDTDTEVIAHLIEDGIRGGLSFEDSVKAVLSRLEGSFAVVAINGREPGKMIGIRKFSPLVLGVGDGEYFLSSDTQAVLPYTNRVLFLEDGDMVVAEASGYSIEESPSAPSGRKVVSLSWDPVQADKGGFKHYMLKEIYEQPRAVLDTISARFDQEAGEVILGEIDPQVARLAERIIMVACGTSYHACCVGKYMIERVARIPVEVDLASEFRYRNPVLGKDVLLIAASQSGETADTIEALLEAKRDSAGTLAITNVPNSKISRDADYAVYTRAGLEIGVASTKAFTTQLAVFYLLSVYLGRLRGVLSNAEARALILELTKLPKHIEMALKLDAEVAAIAGEYYKYEHFLYLGRGINYPIALEGALKLKEISYVHAEAYAAGEMKHGPIALVDENMPVVVLAPNDGVTYTKVLSNIEEISARRGRIILITSPDIEPALSSKVSSVITIPASSYMTSPFVTVVPLQLLAYHIASLKGTDIDQPRNLAKVVTVE